MLLDDVKNYIIKILFCNIMPKAETLPTQSSFTVPVSPGQAIGSKVPGTEAGPGVGNDVVNVIPKNKKSNFDIRFFIIIGVVLFVFALLSNSYYQY